MGKFKMTQQKAIKKNMKKVKIIQIKSALHII